MWYMVPQNVSKEMFDYNEESEQSQLEENALRGEETLQLYSKLEIPKPVNHPLAVH